MNNDPIPVGCAGDDPWEYTTDAIDRALATHNLDITTFDALCIVADGTTDHPAFAPTYDAIDRIHSEVDPSMITDLINHVKGF